MTCPHCGRDFTRSDSLRRHVRTLACVAPPVRTIDPVELLERLEGLNHSIAAQACGVDPSTIRRWRAKRIADPIVVAQVLARLDGQDLGPLKRARGRQAQPGPYVDVHCTHTEDGWIVDAFIHGRNDPIQSVAMAAHAGVRYRSLDECREYAVARFGDRLLVFTPDVMAEEVAA
jgi:hypothetical protein